jgi:hypothetical protein
MPQLYDFINQLAPKMTEWRRDFHLHAESGWLEFRTASKVAEVLTVWVISWRWGATLSMPIAVWACLMKRPWRRRSSAPARRVRLNAGYRRLKAASPGGGDPRYRAAGANAGVSRRYGCARSQRAA